jgi:hypothetical protein
MPRYWISLIAAFFIVGLAGCSDDSSATRSCDADQLYDQFNDECVPRGPLSEPDADGGDTTHGDDADDGGQDTGRDASGGDQDAADDVGGDLSDATDAGEDVDLTGCDKDGDGALAESCGGYDCDDDDPARSPYHTEFCDEIDNNCSGVVNDNVTCTFFAHAGTDLYEIDPFAKKATQISDGLPWLQDIDTHPDGTLFGVNRDVIHRFDPWADAWILQGDFGAETVEDPNGLAIDSNGTAFVTSQDKMYSADLMTGQATFLGTTGSFYSSGDCVVNKQDTLFMTSKEDGQPDQLVQVSRQTGQGNAIGATGFEKIFALTAAWGTLYGLTSGGELIEINQTTGSASLVHTFEGLSFWGAASTPNR